MSQSRRRTPVTAVTTKASDKAFGDPWNGHKDGKSRFDAGRHPAFMRK